MTAGSFDAGSLVAGIVAGAIGVGYIMYGRRQTRFAPVIAGILLCAYPYFVDSLLWLCVIGAVLAVAPFLTDF